MSAPWSKVRQRHSNSHARYFPLPLISRNEQITCDASSIREFVWFGIRQKQIQVYDMDMHHTSVGTVARSMKTNLASLKRNIDVTILFLCYNTRPLVTFKVGFVWKQAFLAAFTIHTLIFLVAVNFKIYIKLPHFTTYRSTLRFSIANVFLYAYSLINFSFTFRSPYWSNII